MVYEILNYFFFGFHTVWILFNSLGWTIARFRKANLIALLLTGFSWFVVGAWRGWGYCFCTDWHWKVRHQMGYSDMHDSYIHFLLFKITGVEFNRTLVDTITVVVYFTSLVVSIYLFNRGKRRKQVSSN